MIKFEGFLMETLLYDINLKVFLMLFVQNGLYKDWFLLLLDFNNASIWNITMLRFRRTSMIGSWFGIIGADGNWYCYSISINSSSFRTIFNSISIAFNSISINLYGTIIIVGAIDGVIVGVIDGVIVGVIVGNIIRF